MKHITFSAVVLCITMMLVPGELSARGFRGGGGRGGGARGGGARVSRPAPRSSAPSMGSRRPAAASRPSRPNVSRPSTRPANVSRPQVQRPSGGFKPSTRPSRPQTRPSSPTNRPNNRLPNAGAGSGGRLPNRPSTRPSVPNLGGGSGNRPNVKPPNRPGDGGRPNLPGTGGRPSTGDLGDFLGMDKPLRPGNGIGNRPGIGNGNGIGNGIGNRPSVGNGNINIGKVNIGRNNVINNRPTWANIDRGRVTNINNRWRNQIGGMHNWRGIHPNRGAFWAGWGAGVRSSYRYHYRNPGCFRGSWWAGHPYRWCGWHYGYAFSRRPWRYWWTVPTYTACVNWFNWSAPSEVWSEPVYYDYGQEGNVVYNDNSVYINGEQVATATEFAQSAADLATVEAPQSDEDAENAEWMPLGTFALSAGEKDVEPTRMVQLAVNKQGIISGTLFNTQTEENQSIQGQVDKETQRVAMRIGESEDLVVETGLYNLTQDEAPLLVHFGTDRVENWLLVRLEDPVPDDTEETQEE
jgi:hypothetical protein